MKTAPDKLYLNREKDSNEDFIIRDFKIEDCEVIEYERINPIDKYLHKEISKQIKTRLKEREPKWKEKANRMVSELLDKFEKEGKI